MDFKNKHVLLFGLGLLGGGVAAVNWLLKEGAILTITDKKTQRELAPSLKQIPRLRSGHVTLRLGGHSKKDIDAAEIIVLNPGVSSQHELIRYAIKKKKQVVNEATLFYHSCIKPIIGVTGTRGKTTTAAWTAHLMGEAHHTMLAGNSPEFEFLKVLPKTKKADWVVTEMPSFQLELFANFEHKPAIAVITNIYQDHFNRYSSYRAYVKTKANLFADQGPEQHLVLNYDNPWTPFLLTIPHRSHNWLFTVASLPPEVDGLINHNGHVFFQHGGSREEVLDLEGFITAWGMHNVQNFLAAALAAHLCGASWPSIQSRIATLPQIPFRQETIYQSERLLVVNDNNATSPEGVIVAVQRYGSPTTILIAGGTDKKLKFENWAKIMHQYILADNIVLLAGSATKKMRAALKKLGIRPAVHETLAQCVHDAVRKANKFSRATILFSPGGSSFEKFTNEYERGEQFNSLVKKLTAKL